MFYEGMPGPRYKKLGKRGFNTSFDQAKHDFQIAEFDRSLRTQGERVFASIGATMRSITHELEDARFRERQQQKEQNRRPMFTTYEER